MPRRRDPGSFQSRVEDAVWVARPRPVTTPDIRALFGCSSAQAARTLFQLEGAGRIQSWGVGSYFVPAKLKRWEKA
jgi:hypothetical protein